LGLPITRSRDDFSFEKSGCPVFGPQIGRINNREFILVIREFERAQQGIFQNVSKMKTAKPARVSFPGANNGAPSRGKLRQSDIQDLSLRWSIWIDIQPSGTVKVNVGGPVTAKSVDGPRRKASATSA
jgi:hypothetical protein